MCSTSGKEPKRLRFSADDDLALLREFISQNPLEDAEKWENMQKNVHEITGKKFNIRTLKDHLFLILEIWLRKDSDSQKKSGVEEIYSERDHLLQEISDLCNSANINPRECKRRKTSNKEKQIAELGRRAREKCALQLNSEEAISSNPANISDHDYLDTFHAGEVVIEEIEVVGTEVGADASMFCFNTSSLGLGAKETRSEEPSFQETPSKSEPIKRILGPKKFRNNKSASMRKSALDYLHHKEERPYIEGKRIGIGRKAIAA